jgi:pimeloyl-ACP methyl ester carboxylesterase
VRLEALRFAFFAPGNDAEPWLKNWRPDVLAAQRIAGDKTPRTEDYASGRAPVLYMQPSHDPLAHAQDAVEYKAALGDRLTVVKIPQSSHAAIAEQPDFIAHEAQNRVKSSAPCFGLRNPKRWRRPTRQSAKP